MSSRFEHIQFAALARAGEGLTQWRPLVMGFITLVLCGLLTVASQWLASSVGGMAAVVWVGVPGGEEGGRSGFGAVLG